MAYHLTADLLRTSNNPILKEFAANNFIFSEIPKVIGKELRDDLMRNLHINHRLISTETGVVRYHDNYDTVAPDDSPPPFKLTIKNLRDGDNQLSDEELDGILEKAFPGAYGDKKHFDLVKTYYTQAIIFYAVAPLTQLTQQFNLDYSISDAKPNIRPSEVKPYYANLYDQHGDTFFEIEIPHYYVTANFLPTHTGASSFPSSTLELKSSKWKFKLLENGFQFLEAEITDKIIFDMFVGQVPPSFKSFPQYGLFARIKDAFHAMYNSNNKSRSDSEAFLGLPDSSEPYQSTLQRIQNNPLGFLRGLIGLPKNSLKLITEFLPLAIEQTANFVIDKTTKNIKSNTLQVLVMIPPMFIISMAFVVRQITSRLTSPVRTFKEAYQFGAKVHPFVGAALATLSAALSLTLFTATAFGATAAFAAAGVPAVAVAASWLTANTAVIGAYASTAISAVIWAVSATTLTLSASTAAVMTGSFLAATAFAAAIWVRDRFKAIAKWRLGRNTTIDFNNIPKEPDPFATEKSSTATAVTHLGIAGDLNKRLPSFDEGIHEVNQQHISTVNRAASVSPIPETSEEANQIDTPEIESQADSDSIVREEYPQPETASTTPRI